MSNSPSAAAISDGALATIAGYSAVAGLCPLIPIPFVDDFIVVRIQRRLYQVLCREHGFELSDAGAKILTDKPSSLIAGALKNLLLWPVKKLITKIVYFLAVKSCADVAAGVFNEAWMFARVIEQEYVPRTALAGGDRATLERLRTAIATARDHVDPSATQAAMKSAFGVGREVFNSVLAGMRSVLTKSGTQEARLDAAEHEVAPISDRIQSEIRKHWANGPAFDAALTAALRGENVAT